MRIWIFVSACSSVVTETHWWIVNWWFYWLYSPARYVVGQGPTYNFDWLSLVQERLMSFQFSWSKFTYTEVTGVLHNEGKADAAPTGSLPKFDALNPMNFRS